MVKAKIYSSGAQAKSYLGLAQEKTIQTATTTKAKTMEIASNKTVQVTAASAAGGAVTLGATGLATGGALGAAIGLVPALFTFGLSIPIGAAIGGASGLVVGTAVGSTAGALGGGATGYGVYTKKDDIRNGAVSALTTAHDCADYVKVKAHESTGFAHATALKLKTRVVGGYKTKTI